MQVNASIVLIVIAIANPHYGLPVAANGTVSSVPKVA